MTGFEPTTARAGVRAGDPTERVEAGGGVRWCPTLVEDPESADLINLLPDIVDSARTAADLIAPAAPRFDRTHREDAPTGMRAWTDVDRNVFEDSLLEILSNADEFRRRVSPPASS